MNLSTARSENRAKEVGVRKVTGAYRSLLIAQFLTEAILIASIGGVIALAAVWLCLPALNNLLGSKVALDFTSPMLMKPTLRNLKTLGDKAFWLERLLSLPFLYPVLASLPWQRIWPKSAKRKSESERSWGLLSFPSLACCPWSLPCWYLYRVWSPFLYRIGLPITFFCRCTVNVRL
ncbi:ABC transporter permease [Sphingobacterium thalpophilum]|uniref:Acidobacterial duplicated orphan permease n=1 Tax=Sphingobacterium thalpophilum TaxID=259 RepID=A0A4U9VW50_9SPHI|nr:acidobacterial duplicated orphan permease [Sphingobacterium thalpophilum]